VAVNLPCSNSRLTTGSASTNRPTVAGMISTIASRSPWPSVFLKAGRPSAWTAWRESVGRMAAEMAMATSPWGNWISVVAQLM